MPIDDLEARIKDRIERKMQYAARKLEELEADGDLQAARDEVAKELQRIQAEHDALLKSADAAESGLRDRLEAHRERLLAKQERLELKAELLQDRRARWVESLEDMRGQLAEALDGIRSRAASAKTGASSYGAAPEPAATPSRKMVDERRKILEMVEKGTISAQEAGQLLDALRDQEDNDRRTRRKPRWVRIRVTDTHDVVRVNLTLPVGLVRAGLRAGGSIAGVEGLDTAGLEEMLDRGELGHLLDVQDRDRGERVEIFVE
ncbi:MAG: hypothetical protein MUF84_09545 [Anaerolineae bacterium]|nr:hypothetical protein [Anaerolineae bacterium]